MSESSIIDYLAATAPSLTPEERERYRRTADQLKVIAEKFPFKTERVIPVHDGVAYPQYSTLRFVRKDTNEKAPDTTTGG